MHGIGNPQKRAYLDAESIATDISRFLITLGLAILVIGRLWPVLGKLGLGRLPGDIVIRCDNFSFYFRSRRACWSAPCSA